MWVAGANGAQATGQEPAHAAWPGRRVIAAWFGAFTIYAGAMAVFAGHADSAWGVWAFGAYAVTTMLLWFTEGWLLTLVVAVGGALVAPLFWLVTRVPATAEVLVLGRSAAHLLKYGTPYLPPSQLSDWKAYNPYLPVMELFGLPRSAGLSGVLGDPRTWVALTTSVLLATAFAVISPHKLHDCADCRRRVAVLTALALASPVIAYPLALGITDPPVIAMLCLALAWAGRGKLLRAALVLAVGCAMKSTAWAAVPVLAVMAWIRYAPRAAARFTVTAVGATGILALLAAPDALATPDAVKAVRQNLLDFPLGLTKHKTPAASPLPGHLVASIGTVGHLAAVALMVLAVVAFAAWVIMRPPRDARDAAWRLAVGYTVVFVLDPSTRFGYFVYPLALVGWLALTKIRSPERTAATPPQPLLVLRADRGGGCEPDPPGRVMCPDSRAGKPGLASSDDICLEEQDMAKPEAVFVYIGTYQDKSQARDDYQIVRDLHSMGAVGTYDAAVVTKDDRGKVHVSKDEMATRHGAWGGAAAGAVIGILFPPSVIGTALVGAAVGGVSGHLWRGMSRADVKEFGDIIDAGQAALVVIGESKVQHALDKAALKAEKHVAKELNVSPEDIDEAVRETARQVS